MPDSPDEFIPTRASLLSRLTDWDDQESWRDFFKTYRKLTYCLSLLCTGCLTPRLWEDRSMEAFYGPATNANRVTEFAETTTTRCWPLAPQRKVP